MVLGLTHAFAPATRSRPLHDRGRGVTQGAQVCQGGSGGGQGTADAHAALPPPANRSSSRRLCCRLCGRFLFQPPDTRSSSLCSLASQENLVLPSSLSLPLGSVQQGESHCGGKATFRSVPHDCARLLRMAQERRAPSDKARQGKSSPSEPLLFPSTCRRKSQSHIVFGASTSPMPMSARGQDRSNGVPTPTVTQHA